MSSPVKRPISRRTCSNRSRLPVSRPGRRREFGKNFIETGKSPKRHQTMLRLEASTNLPAASAPRRRNNAKAQTWKTQLGCFGSRARLHGNELFLWSTSRQAGDDHSSPGSRGTRHNIFRYGRGLWPVFERGTRG